MNTKRISINAGGIAKDEITRYSLPNGLIRARMENGVTKIEVMAFKWNGFEPVTAENAIAISGRHPGALEFIRRFAPELLVDEK